jgi:hypothetical protein
VAKEKERRLSVHDNTMDFYSSLDYVYGSEYIFP